MKIIFYLKSNGKAPVEKYIDDLSLQEQARILSCLKSLENDGFDTPRVQFRQIQNMLWEIKIKSGISHRIFYVVIDKEELVLLHAYKKQTQKAPLKEIKIAKSRMQEVLNGKKKNIR